MPTPSLLLLSILTCVSLPAFAESPPAQHPPAADETGFRLGFSLGAGAALESRKHRSLGLYSLGYQFRTRTTLQLMGGALREPGGDAGPLFGVGLHQRIPLGERLGAYAEVALLPVPLRLAAGAEYRAYGGWTLRAGLSSVHLPYEDLQGMKSTEHILAGELGVGYQF